MLSVLVVDDDELVLRALKSLLVDEGCHVVAISTVDEARLTLREQQFDVLLVDWHMPKTPGIVLCEEAVRAAATRHVILMSADPEIQAPRGVRTVSKLGLVTDVRKMLKALGAEVVEN